MKHKIVAIHCYAAVELGVKRKRLNYITSERGGVEFSYVDDLGVKVTGGGTTIIVPFSNIASIQIKEEVVAKPAPKPQSEKKPTFAVK